MEEIEKGKRILVINWRDPLNPASGGAEDYVFEIAKILTKKGYKISWVSNSFEKAPEEEFFEGIRIIRLKGPVFLFIWNFYKFYKEKLQNENYDLVIDNVSKIPLFTPLYIKNTPLLGIFHQFHGEIFFKELFFPVSLICFILEILLVRFYKNQKMVVNSESTREELVKKGFPLKNTFLVNPGIHHEKYNFSLSQKTSWPSCVYLGRLKKYKGIDHLLKAWKIVVKDFPSAQLFIVGRGDDLARLKRIVKFLKLEKSVEFLGFLKEEEKNRVLTKSWIMVYPSLKEGFGISLIEANASGVPVIGYRVSGVKDVIKDKITGYLLPYRDILNLANSIKEIFSDATRRNVMSFEAKEFSKNFSWQKSAEQFEKVINEVLKK